MEFSKSNSCKNSIRKYVQYRCFKSKFVDSYAWDTTCKWLKNSEVIKEDNSGKINSTNYGNYDNSTFAIPKGTLYTKHIYLTK